MISSNAGSSKRARTGRATSPVRRGLGLVLLFTLGSVVGVPLLEPQSVAPAATVAVAPEMPPSSEAPVWPTPGVDPPPRVSDDSSTHGSAPARELANVISRITNSDRHRYFERLEVLPLRRDRLGRAVVYCKLSDAFAKLPGLEEALESQVERLFSTQRGFVLVGRFEEAKRVLPDGLHWEPFGPNAEVLVSDGNETSKPVALLWKDHLVITFDELNPGEVLAELETYPPRLEAVKHAWPDADVLVTRRSEHLAMAPFSRTLSLRRALRLASTVSIAFRAGDPWEARLRFELDCSVTARSPEGDNDAEERCRGRLDRLHAQARSITASSEDARSDVQVTAIPSGLELSFPAGESDLLPELDDCVRASLQGSGEDELEESP